MSDANSVIETFYNYMGSVIWIFLFAISCIYILCKKKREERKVIFGVVILSILCIYNDISRIIIGKVVGTSAYYRFLWLVPVPIICSYALVLFVSQKYKMKYKILVCTGVALCTIMGGKTFWSGSIIPENKYLMPDDVWEIADLIQNDKTEKVPTIAMPLELMNYISYDADAVMGIGREAYIYFSKNGYENVPEQYQTESILAQIVYQNSAQDILKTKAAISRRRIDYLVISNKAGLETFMEEIDCALVGMTENYQLYRVKYNVYERITDVAQIDQIESEMGISVDQEKIAIKGVENTYKLLAINDLHDFALDNSVSDENIQTIYDRYNMLFRSTTGVHTLDLWNGLSAIIDSYGADEVIFIGDMIDYSSPINSDLLKRGLTNIKTPYIYLRADHDLGMSYAIDPSYDVALQRTAEIAEYEDVIIKDFGEFYLVGWNNSTSQLSNEGLQTMKEVFAEGKPIILATHVPLDSIVEDSLYETSKAVDPKERALLWGERCTYKPDDTTEEFLEMIYAEDSPVQAVLAGHLHLKYTVKLTDKITEYVFPPAFSGNITMITIENE